MMQPPPSYDGNEVVQIATVVPAYSQQALQQQAVQAQQMQQMQQLQQTMQQQQQAMEQMEQMHQQELQMQRSQNELEAQVAAQKQQMAQMEAKHKEEVAALQQPSVLPTAGSASVTPARVQGPVANPGTAPVVVPWPTWMPAWVPMPAVQDIAADKKQVLFKQTLLPVLLITLLWLIPYSYFAPIIVSTWASNSGAHHSYNIPTSYVGLTSWCYDFQSHGMCMTGAPYYALGKLTLFVTVCLGVLVIIIWSKNFPAHPNMWAGKEFNKKFFAWAFYLLQVDYALSVAWIVQVHLDAPDGGDSKTFPGWGWAIGSAMIVVLQRAIRVINSMPLPAQSTLARAPMAASGTA